MTLSKVEQYSMFISNLMDKSSVWNYLSFAYEEQRCDTQMIWCSLTILEMIYLSKDICCMIDFLCIFFMQLKWSDSCPVVNPKSSVVASE